MFIWSLIECIFHTLLNVLDDDILFILLSIICILLSIRFKYKLLKLNKPIVWSDAHHKIYHLDIEIGFWIFTIFHYAIPYCTASITRYLVVRTFSVILWRHPKNRFGVTESKIRLNLISFRLMYDLFTTIIIQTNY